MKNDEKKDEFTHVVVGIEYGGTCTLVFERKIKDFETKENIEGALSVALNSFPASGEAGLKLNNDVKEKIGSFKCSVYSDLKLDACVTNLDEALSLFKSLPKKLFPSGERDAQRGVPVRIWLLPKNALGCQLNNLVKEPSNDVVKKLKHMIESKNTAINDSRDLLNMTEKFPALNSKISRFIKLVENYFTTFQKDILSNLLVSIRIGKKNEEQLHHTVENHEHSPFGYLNKWIGKMKEEVSTLLATQKQLSDVCVSFEQNIVKKTTNVVFTLKVSKNEDQFIDEMEIYYNRLAKEKVMASEVKTVDIMKKRKWFEDESFKEKMREMTVQMKNFASVNQFNEEAGFFVREIECEQVPDCYFDVWVNGEKLAFKSFEPPTEIRELLVKEYSHDTIEIKWNVPHKGRSTISNYIIKVI